MGHPVLYFTKSHQSYLDSVVERREVDLDAADGWVLLHGDVLRLEVLGHGGHLLRVGAPPVHHLLHVLVVRHEPHVVVHVALGPERKVVTCQSSCQSG